MDIGGESVLAELKVEVDMIEDGDWFLDNHDCGWRLIYGSGLD